MTINYENVQVELPYEILNIENLKLTAGVNEHHTLILEALINEENADEYLLESVENKDVRLLIDGKVIYVGKIIKLDIHYKNQIAYMSLKTISYSYDLDIRKHRQAFSNLESTYENVISNVLSKYSNVDFKDNITYGNHIKDLLVQYDETDFEFMKRLATHFQSVIVVDSTANMSRLYFGVEIIDSDISLNSEFREAKTKLDDFTKILCASKENLTEQNFISWKVNSREYLPLGSQVSYEGQKVIVTKLEINKVKSEFIYTYELKFPQGIKTIYKINPKLKGVSIEGIVKNRRNNEIQVYFCINDSYEESDTNKWFPYAREVSNFYCMPLPESKVNITFISGNEKDTIATNAVRIAEANAKYYEKASTPNNKSYSTENGQELSITPDMVQISADEGKSIQVSLNNSGSVSITGGTINIHSNSNVVIGNSISSSSNENSSKPDSISISAKNKVTVTRSSTGINTAHSIQLSEENHLKGIIIMS